MTDSSGVDIDHLAKLARLRLSPEEKEKFSHELPAILHFVEELQSVTLSAQAQTKQVVPLESLRDDVPSSENLSLEQLKALAPDFRDDQVVVPAVFGEAENA
jgi:aspartyl-tRNA(Asn)/glutamyl-tRNA(Gln) amidotransferase subunit C